MKKTLIIDGDIVLFPICRVTEDITDFGDDVLESYDTESAIRLLEHELGEISKRTGYKVDEMVFAISSDKNFRKRFFPSYKRNRENVRKPLGLKAMRQHVIDNVEKYQTVMIEELEADDVMGMYATAPVESVGSEIAIYSKDKDLLTVPAKQWDFKKSKFIHPTPMESTKFLYTQVLTGDTVDGYKGCPKIGKIKAAKALKPCETEIEMLETCHKLYYKAYKEEAMSELLKQMGQARILHFMDSQMLFQFDELYNPYTMMEVTDEMLRLWEAS